MAASTQKRPTSSITHRLAATTASAALRKESAAENLISTGSAQIDSLLSGGLTKGKVVEIHGPPGSGKTTVGITASINAVARSSRVAWISCANPISLSRVLEVSSRLPTPSSDSSSTAEPPVSPLLDNFHQFTAPTLAHLLALILRPPASFPPANTSLLVIDSVSTLFTLAFPFLHNSSVSGSTGTSFTGSGSSQANASSRRYAIQRDLVAGLNKLAAVHDIAVLVTSQMVTRIDREITGPTSERSRAMLRPALNVRAWTEGFWARVGLVRHWGPQIEKGASGKKKDSKETTNQGKRTTTRFAGLVKLGSVEYETFGRVVAFDIDKTGIIDASFPSSSTLGSHTTNKQSSTAQTLAPQGRSRPSATPITSSSTIPAKRSAREIADSESEGDERADDEDDEVEEVDENGLTRSQQELLDWELGEAMVGAEEVEGA